MAVHRAIKEKVHLPIYDSLRVAPRMQLRDVETSSILKFFVNVQGKTKLETNLPSASLFPGFDSFEAQAMRVVISDLPAEFPVEITITSTGLAVTDDKGVRLDGEGHREPLRGGTDKGAFVEENVVTADVGLSLRQVVDLLRKARESDDGFAALAVDDEAVTLKATTLDEDAIVGAGGAIWLSTPELEAFLANETFVNEKNRPLREQILPNDGAGNLIGKLIYNTVTSLFVGDKIMIQMPTWFFPGGAGPSSGMADVTTHGKPSPTATFRFAEPIFIDKQQNFRVEIEAPHVNFLKEMQRIYGPLFIWVVLDGFMIRDVQ
jgi:hypothetical protein